VSHPLRRGLRRARRWLALSVALLLIASALVVAIASQLLPLLERHPDEVAAWLQQRIGQPVAISGVSARWSRRGPVLDLQGLHIGGDSSSAGGIDIGSARVRINVYAGLLPGQPLLTLRAEGVRLELARTLEGRWQVRGVRARGGIDIEHALAQLDRIGEVEIYDGELVIEDRYADVDVRFERIDARLRTLGGRFRFALRVYAENSPPLRLTADMDTSLRHGLLHLGARQLDLPSWLQGSRLEGLGLESGQADLDLWVEVDEGRLQQVDSVAELKAFQLQRRSEAGLASPDTAAGSLQSLALRLHVAREGEGWRLQLPELRLASADAQSLSGLALRWQGERLAARLDQFDAAALVDLLPALGLVSPELAEWLQQARPRGRLEQLELSLGSAGIEHVSARLESLGLDAVGARPGFRGLSARLSGSASILQVDLDAPEFVIDAPQSLREPLPAALSGALMLWQADEGARIEASPLRVVGPDFAFTVEGAAWADGEGRRPSVDLRAVVEPGPITAAHRFWVLNKMPPKTVEWLQRGIVEGRLASGVAMLRGDLDDWPFKAAEGVLIARAEVEDVVLNYLPDWPIGTQLTGGVDFLNDSLEAEVSAQLLGLDIERAFGRISSFKEPVLELELSGGGSGARLLALVRESPLWNRFGSAMRGLSVGGSGRARLSITAPLKKELGTLDLQGQVDLLDADLLDTQWGLRFGAASGRLRFSEDGFSADELGVRFDGQPGSLSLAAGSFSADPEQAFEASLSGSFGADSLLSLREELHWLEPYLVGSSLWSIELGVPSARQAASTDGPRPAAALPLLRVRSDLRGTALRLPAPLRKPEQGALPLDLKIRLPVQEGGLDLQLGRLLHLLGTPGESAAEFRGAAAFGAEAPGALPEAGLVVRGSAPIVDAPAWIALALSGVGGGEGLQINEIDIEAGLLSFGDRGMADQRLSLLSLPDGSRQLRLDGPSAKGQLLWPSAPTEPVLGRFERLHWPPGPEDSDDGPPRKVLEPDPTGLPAIDLEIDDARFGEAELGRLELLTRRGPDGALVERLSTRSGDLAIDIRGDWSRSLQGSESRFTIGISGDDLGRMLQAFGIDPLVQGGKTRADMDLRWAGGPANFAFANADGQLRLEVGKGRVPELEPGAGRFLGLLSLAEIPRRLALDFSDFFRSGLAFNSIEGLFQLAGGNAVTENLKVLGPAAEIHLSGRTGLATRDYDLQVEVLPRTGSVLPALGALTAGPAGAAVGAVAQAVLQAPMKQMNRTLYRVSGVWDEPEIEVIERGPARDAEAPAREGSSARRRGTGPASIESTAPQPAAEAARSSDSNSDRESDSDSQ